MLYVLLLFTQIGFKPPNPIVDIGEIKVQKLIFPKEAVTFALNDVKKFLPVDRQFQKYIWNKKKNKELVDFTLNAVISKTNRIHLCDEIFKGELLRIDLRNYKPVGNWDSLLLEREPYFHIEIKGQVFNAKYVEPELRELCDLCSSNVPIVEARWLIQKLTTTLNGGRYYDFIGIKGSTQEKYLADNGLIENDVKTKFQSDKRSIKRFSKITGKERRIDFYHGSAGKSTGLIAITHDVTDEDFRPENSATRNLAAFNDKAREIFVEKRNDLLEFTLFNNFGKLQLSVPDNIAIDHNIPAPYTKRLEPAISCIRCHGINADDGFIDAVSDLSPKRLNIFGDNKGADLDRLYGLYNENATKIARTLRNARNNYSDAVFEITNGQSVKELSTNFANLDIEYKYTTLNAQSVLQEMGILVEKQKAIELINIILPDLTPDELGISPEDPIIGELKEGHEITREEFITIAPDVLERGFIKIKELMK